MDTKITYIHTIILLFTDIVMALTPELDIESFFNTTDNNGRPFTEIAHDFGYQTESYDVITEDGYILKLFRIPGDVTRPVLFVHGVTDTSDGYILRGNTSLAVALAQSGYDVWATNCRGNRYSRRHVVLNPDLDPEFWNYSFQEIGFYDIPASIDFVLNETGQSQLSAAGHSEGTTVFFVLGATRPEYSGKIKVFIALAPICYLSHVKPPVSDIVKLGPFLDILFTALGVNEFLGYHSIARAVIIALCSHGQPSYDLCIKTIVFSLAGYDPANVEVDFLPTIIGHYPAGTSRKNLVHFTQVANRNKFSKYDYGSTKNLAVYESITPPDYDLGSVKFGVVLICAENDKLSTLLDVGRLRSELPNVVGYHVVEYDLFNHIDHILGRNAHLDMFPFVLDALKGNN